MVFIRNRLKYALNKSEVVGILKQRLVQVSFCQRANRCRAVHRRRAQRRPAECRAARRRFCGDASGDIAEQRAVCGI